MASCLDGSILNFFRDLLTKLPLWFAVLSKVGMVSSITLDTDSPALLGHPKYKGPSIFRVQVSIGKHQKALVLFEVDMLFKVFKYLSCMELFDSCIHPHPCLHYTLTLELIQVEFNMRSMSSTETISIWRCVSIGLDPSNWHASEKDLDGWLHVVDQHFLEVLFIGSKSWINVIIPHFQYDGLVNGPILALFLKSSKGLWLFLSVFINPILSICVPLLLLMLTLYDIVQSFEVLGKHWLKLVLVHLFNPWLLCFALKRCLLNIILLLNFS